MAAPPDNTLGDFTAQAAAYARARPTYPAELVDRLLARAGVKPGDCVSDLGAGTGIFTRLLCGRGLHVTAVEPNAAMRAQAAELPEVAWVSGTFEQPNLPPASQHWIAAAQAFHWADPPRALPQVAAALRPGAAFTVLWNSRDTAGSPTVQFVTDQIRKLAPNFNEGYRDRDWPSTLTSTGHFKGVVHDVSRHVVPMSAARFVDLFASHNHLANTAGPAAVAALLDGIRAYLSERDMQVVDVPYTCNAWTAFAS